MPARQIAWLRNASRRSYPAWRPVDEVRPAKPCRLPLRGHTSSRRRTALLEIKYVASAHRNQKRRQPLERRAFTAGRSRSGLADKSDLIGCGVWLAIPAGAAKAMNTAPGLTVLRIEKIGAINSRSAPRGRDVRRLAHKLSAFGCLEGFRTNKALLLRLHQARKRQWGTCPPARLVSSKRNEYMARAAV